MALATVRQELFDRAMCANVRREDGAAFRAAIGRLDMLIVTREGVDFVDIFGAPADVELVNGECKNMKTPKIVAPASVEKPPRTPRRKPAASGCEGLSELLVIGKPLTDEQIALEVARDAACESGDVEAMRAVALSTCSNSRRRSARNGSR